MRVGLFFDSEENSWVMAGLTLHIEHLGGNNLPLRFSRKDLNGCRLVYWHGTCVPSIYWGIGVHWLSSTRSGSSPVPR